ncbi:hypothetical protein ACHAXT_006299 [Thalassiosira profunda]
MMKDVALMMVSLLCASEAYINVAPPRQSKPPRRISTRLNVNERAEGAPFDENSSSEHDGDESASFAQSLSQRIAEVEQSESSFVAGLQKRVKSVAKAEEFDTSISANNGDHVVELPVICLDALLPNQRMTGSTTDPTFCNFLRSMGLGGTFMMTSLNNRQRKIRRFGVVARIELVDVDGSDANEESNEEYSILSTPTAVSFSIVGTRRCEVLGSGKDMKDRIGRWRRSYDPDGEESRLGWGDERFVDKSDEVADEAVSQSNSDDTWSSNKVSIIDEASEDDATTDAIAKATYLIPLIERWISLASDQTTYDNVDVVAGTRRKSGEPGLSVNASALLRKVQQELGPMPPPGRPTAFAVWGAALVNPLPALGVATEVRGAVLEAEGAERKLAILERGLVRSINNLDGKRPLNM